MSYEVNEGRSRFFYGKIGKVVIWSEYSNSAKKPGRPTLAEINEAVAKEFPGIPPEKLRLHPARSSFGEHSMVIMEDATHPNSAGQPE